MKNILAENMLRFGPRNLTESEKRNLSKLAEQDADNVANPPRSASNGDSLNLGQKLNKLNLQPGAYQLEKELAAVNIFMAKTSDTTSGTIDSGTINSNQPEFSGAYARQLYLLTNNTSRFFIGRSMSGGPISQGKGWSLEPGYKIVKPGIDNSGFVTRSHIRQEVLNTKSAVAAYIQIYNFHMDGEGFRDNPEITKLVQLLESDGVIPSLQDEINDSAYNTFLQHRHDSVMTYFKK